MVDVLILEMFHALIVWNFVKLKVKCKCNLSCHNTEMSLVFIPEIGIEISFKPKL